MGVKIGDDILYNVQKPARYTGNEWNIIQKDLTNIKMRFAFCFPDVYEIGMSNLGMKIMYHLINKREDAYCERVFAPWADMEEKMRNSGIPLYALESNDPVSDFDIVGFTLQYEMSYTNILNMIDLGGIPVKKADRTNEHPLICAGGPCAYNPEPLADFVDFFVIGDGEEVINDILDEYVNLKVKSENKLNKTEFLKKIANIRGIYVPEFYDVEYNDNKTVKSVSSNCKQAPDKITKRVVENLDKVFYPTEPIVPFIDVVHNRAMLELFRGCTRGCRFCQAGFVYRPSRERSVETLTKQAEQLIKNTGYDEMSLLSLSTSDYEGLPQLTDELVNKFEGENVSISLPSLRIDSFSLELMQKVQKVRKSGLTFAPEAGSQRLRDVINKGVTEEDLLNAVSIAFEGGWSSVKLYFMLGLPTETMEDVISIAELAQKVVTKYKQVVKGNKAKRLSITVSTSFFIPKPFTPFQWEPQEEINKVVEKQQVLKEKLRSKFIKYNWHDPYVSFIEAVLSRGDRRLGDVIFSAWKNGCKFDSWSEYFKFDRWMETFKQCNIDPYFYSSSEGNFDDFLPWGHIDIGVTKKYLISENLKAKENKTTPNCRQECCNCGAAFYQGGVCFDKN